MGRDMYVIQMVSLRILSFDNQLNLISLTTIFYNIKLMFHITIIELIHLATPAFGAPQPGMSK